MCRIVIKMSLIVSQINVIMRRNNIKVTEVHYLEMTNNVSHNV